MKKLGKWYASLFIDTGLAKKKKNKHGKRTKFNK